MIESAVIQVEEPFMLRILKFATAINSRTKKNVILLKSSISSKPPLNISFLIKILAIHEVLMMA